MTDSGPGIGKGKKPQLAPMTSQALAYFDGSETVESLLAEWSDTKREMTLEDVTRHNLIPLRLLHMGVVGQRALLDLAPSRIASSNEELSYQRQLAEEQLDEGNPLQIIDR